MMMRMMFAALLTLLPVAAIAGTEEDKAAIRTVIDDMEAAWNRGDFAGYVAGFSNPDVIFVSGGKYRDGWQGTLDEYRRKYGASDDTRGVLTFYDMHIELLADDAAMLIGRYHLERPKNTNEGINTRLFRKVDGDWRIAMNHVSAHDVPSEGEFSPPLPRYAAADRPGPPAN